MTQQLWPGEDPLGKLARAARLFGPGLILGLLAG
jgi:hypothetical protein